MTVRAMAEVRAAVQAIVPDTPAWVEARAMTLDDAAWAAPAGPGGWVLGSDAAKLVVCVGGADPRVAVEAIATRTGWTLLAGAERDDVAAAARAAGRAVGTAAIHTLPDPDLVPDGDGASALAPGEELGHLPPALRDELAGAQARGRQVWAARVDGRPVSVAYAPWRSETWFDVSVDTAPGFRQLGLATVVAAAMIRAEQDQGRQAVWGADDDNAASLRLAARLGFAKVAALWVIA